MPDETNIPGSDTPEAETPAPETPEVDAIAAEAAETEQQVASEPGEDEANPPEELTGADADEVEISASEHPELANRQLRILEALLFASAEPLGAAELAPHLGEAIDAEPLLLELQRQYAPRGIHLVRRADKWAFRTAVDLNFLLVREQTDNKPLSRAALETLAIIAYHQPATRAEVEEVRGVATGKGTLDLLMEAGWIRMRGRRRTPGRPVTYGTTEAFLDHFGLESLADLPGLEELKGAGLLSNRLPPNMQIPLPFDGPLREDEDPLDPDDIEGQDEEQ
ncbi:MAG: SMC-Scp complex subunit ScpB [Devosia sp.]|uniref:SMC-Scp complex subunit ScpB n=1 Tax=Devosia sp. TaxID=1871048 RepID=UPI001A4272A0|nr:SMC-Scp complex subunit ScpB [Devosia sp.]MBL8599674.1 SMC-Scp complex subunit ScpB [Devosia sp.]